MNAKVGAVRAKRFGRHSQLDRLLENIACGPGGRVGPCVPMAKGQETDLLHGAKASRLIRGNTHDPQVHAISLKEPRHPDEMSAKKSCSVCGNEFEPTVKFCPDDGTPLREIEAADLSSARSSPTATG